MNNRTCFRCLRLDLRSIRRQSTSVKRLLAENDVGKSVTVSGWINHRRKLKNATFLDIADGSTFQTLQAVANGTPERFNSEYLSNGSATVGSSVRLKGTLVESRGRQNVELHVKGLEVLGESSEEPNLFPIQFKGKHTADHLRTWQHLRPRTALMASLFRTRSHLVTAFHQFFNQEGFYYTNPPIITRSDAEGAGESFHVTGSDKDFFGLGDKTPRLTVSSQLHLEALMMGLGRVWTLSPTFRAEKSITSRHLAEFWMLEAEWGVDDLDELLSLVERMIRSVTEYLKEENVLQELMATVKGQDNTVDILELPARWDKMTSKNWTRMTYHEAVELLLEEHSHRPFDISPEHGSQLQSSHEQFLASQSPTPIFITHYPTHIKPFYMLKSSEDPSKVSNFDLLVPGMGEIAGGSLRIHDLAELEQSMRDNGMDQSELEWYMDLRRWGTIPHGGFGLGFDRLIGYLTGVTNLREVVAFPRMFGKSGCLN